ncbi:MAG: hypothetical protein VB139_04315 [Coriobacteriia bacterium]|nr:hypothetical protein [Coriobacteriia bacterium]
MERRSLRHSLRHPAGLLHHPREIEVAEASREQMRPGPRPLGRDTLCEQHADQERLRMRLDERIGGRNVGEGATCLCGAEHGELLAVRAQRRRGGTSRYIRGPFVRKNTHVVQTSFAADERSTVGSSSSHGSVERRCVSRSHLE